MGEYLRSISAVPITQQELFELFDYHKNEGALYWKTSRQCIAAGTRAGTVTKKGHRRIKIDGQEYLEHRLIWLMFKGEIRPGENVIHRDGDKGFNAIENLMLINKYTCEEVDLG